MAARGDICPQLGPGAAIVPSRTPARGSGLPAPSAPPRGPLSLGTKVAGAAPGVCGRAPAGSACEAGVRVPVAASGDLVRGCWSGPRTRPGARREGRSGGALSAAPRPPRISRLYLASQQRSRASVAVSEPARRGARQGPQARFVTAAGYSSCVAGAPEGRGRDAAAPLSRSRSRRDRSGGGGRDPPRPSGSSLPLPGGPSGGAAGGAGPISILIAGLGAHLDRGLITGRTLGAPAGRARRSPFSRSSPPPAKSAPTLQSDRVPVPLRWSHRPVVCHALLFLHLVLFHSPGPPFGPTPPPLSSVPFLHRPPLFPHFCLPSANFSVSPSPAPGCQFLPLCQFPIPWLPTLLMTGRCQSTDTCVPRPGAPKGIVWAALACPLVGRACSPWGVQQGGAAGPRPWPSVQNGRGVEHTWGP